MEENNKCVPVQPGRVMFKYTFNNRPVGQHRDRSAAVEWQRRAQERGAVSGSVFVLLSL